MLDAIVAAKFPIEKSMLYSILGLKDEPRVPDRERKEAINLLHQLFPVENDHVSAFHKTVIDWLTTGDHYYRVKGDGCGVLANKCYNVINSIKQNRHLQDQLPDLTDRDKYALTFGLDYYEESFSEEKKIEMQTDPEELCLEAFSAAQNYYNRDEVGSIGYRYDNLLEQHLSDDCKAIYNDLEGYFTRKHPTPWRKHPTYVQLLEFAYREANLLNIGDTAKTLAYLKENGIPYHERQTLLELNNKELVQQILACNDGFLLVLHENRETLVRKYQLNGNLVKEVSFDGHKKLYMSPDDRFIVAIPLLDESDIGIVDAATLQTIKSYKSPNVVKSCHVFGSQPWYMVVRCFNNKIYVMDGETGKLVGHPTAVQQNDDVLAVSKVGHILIARTSEFVLLCDDQLKLIGSLTDKDILEIMIFKPGFNSKSTRYSLRECFLSDYKNLDDKMPVCARLPLSCQNYRGLSDNTESNEQPLCFSEDGDLLAFHYCECITVVHTSDGSLYKSVCLSFYKEKANKILFLSKERVIIINGWNRKILSFTFGENEREFLLEHIFNLPAEYIDVCRVITSKENNIEAIIAVKQTREIPNVNIFKEIVLSKNWTPSEDLIKIPCAILKYNFFQFSTDSVSVRQISTIQ